MTGSEFETCEQCGARVRVEQTVEDFGQAAHGSGPVTVVVVACAQGHRFPRPDTDGLTPDRA